MTTKENLKPKGKETKAVLFYDRELFEKSLKELKTQVEKARYLAEVWKSAGNLPSLTGELFRRWLQNPNLIYETYQQAANEKIDKDYWPGASQQMKDKFELKLNDPERVQRLLKTFESPAYRPEVFWNVQWISFDSGNPYISDETMELIKQRCTVDSDPEIEKAIKTLKEFVKCYNSLKEFAELKSGRSINLSDMPGFKPTTDGITADVGAMLHELFFKNSPDFQQQINIGYGAPETQQAKKVKTPEGFKLKKDTDPD
jgi:hypothetical protein